MQRFEGLLNRSGVIESMDLQKIDIIGIKTAEGGFNCIEDCCAGKSYTYQISTNSALP
jgi:hypothetical protein